MAGPVKPSRGYDASGRRERSRETRRAVLAAATRLFLDRGYAATTMADVADAAGVAVQTVYSTVGGKATLLKEALDVAIVGDDEPVAVVDRPEIHAVIREADGVRKLERYAAFLARAQERTAPLDRVIRAAADADPAVAELVTTQFAARHEGMTQFAQNLADRGLLRRGVTVARAADVLTAHMDAANYLALVTERGWTPGQYRRWYVTVTAAALLADGCADRDVAGSDVPGRRR